MSVMPTPRKETAVTVDKTTYKMVQILITAQSNTDIQTAIGGGATGVTGADIKFKDGQYHLDVKGSFCWFIKPLMMKLQRKLPYD